MDRIVAWYRLSSSVGAVVALVIANAVPLLGVLFLGWSVWNILIVYWLENGIVGAWNILKIARAEGSDVSSGFTINGRPPDALAKPMLIPFFVMHYGIFWAVHGVFVLTLPRFTGLFGSLGGGVERGPATGIDLGTIALAVVALVISHGLSFWWNFLRGGEYRRVSPGRQMFAPYGRLVVLHLTIIFGAMAVITTGAPAAALAILVVAKIVLDLGFHLAEHRRAGAAAA